MSILEIFIFCFVFIALITRLYPKLRPRLVIRILPFVAAVLVPVQIIIDGYRWQMFPIYCIVLLLVIIHVIKMGLKKDYFIRIKAVRVTGVVISFIVFVASLALPSLLPVVDLPKPSGPYAVGKTSYRMTDPEREEICTADPDDSRSLLVTAWYPAEVVKGLPASTYWDKDGITGRSYSQNAGMGTFWYSHLSLVRTNSFEGASLSDAMDAYPVIIYSPSFYGLNNENTLLFEELASNGYVVFSIAHTYETIVSVFPDGEAVPGDLEHISGLYDSHAETEEQLYLDYLNTGDTGEKTQLLKQILQTDDLSTKLLDIGRRTPDSCLIRLSGSMTATGFLNRNWTWTGSASWGGPTAARPRWKPVSPIAASRRRSISTDGRTGSCSARICRSRSRF